MRPQPRSDMELLNTFVKSAQYIVGLSTRQDLWDHLGRLVVTHLKAQWTAFIKQDPEGGLSVDHCSLGEGASQTLLTGEVRAIARDVLDSGFLASQVIEMPAPSMTVFLPVSGEHTSKRVLLIGHAGTDRPASEVLDIYLALAGLAGSMLERLHVETELHMHRAHLEELVKARTEELANAKRQNELILDSITEGILGVDTNGTIRFVNPAAGALTDWGPRDLVGRSAHDTFHHTKCDGTAYPSEQCAIHETLTSGRTIVIADSSFYRRDGSSFPVEFKTSPIFEDGRIVGAVLVFRDVTDQYQTAQELERSYTEMQQFAYVASHDLQEPLRMVRGFLQLLRDRYEANLDDKAHEYIQFAVDGASRMSHLINDLLEYSRIQSRPRQPAATDMKTVFDDAVANCGQSIAETQAAVTCNGLPAVIGDHTQLVQLLQNLIGNAIKFRRQDVPPKIHVSACQDKNRWLVSVEDNGIGIPEDQLDRIFDIFQRLHTREQYPGTGIGLAICKRIVERHGGSIWVESKVESGSKFLFTLPS